MMPSPIPILLAGTQGIRPRQYGLRIPPVNFGFEGIWGGIFKHLEERTWGPIGDLLFLAARSYDPASGRLTSEYTTIQGGKVEVAAASYRVYTYRELVAFLRQAGFGEVSSYGGVDGAPFQLGSRDLLLTAVKP